MSAGVHNHTFGFEAEFSSNLRCIPMAVRRKLDLSGCKLRLQTWLELPKAERQRLLEWGDSKADLEQLRQELRNCCTAIKPARQEPWQQITAVPKCLIEACAAQAENCPNTEQWQQLNELQRFALIKLSKPDHAHRNLPLALAEFQARPNTIEIW